MQASPVTSSASPDRLVPATRSKELGKDDFLQLLVTQLRHQDPLHPMDGTQFTAQLAQFSSLEQLTRMQSSLGDVLIAQMSTANLAATSLLGKTIKAAGDSVSVKDGKASPISYTLAQAAASVSIQIYDAKGVLVRTITKGSQPAGDQQIAWDATDDQGKTVPEGAYTVKAVATGPKGETVGITVYQTGKVSGVTYQGGVAYLLLGQQKVQMGQILEVFGS
ncbi:MAG: flagellar hook assembly protein FlgD [Nitrospinae bacterium]|nr:flagellar hook assembly protein FlgD [Nitrospinota bacterium]